MFKMAEMNMTHRGHPVEILITRGVDAKRFLCNVCRLLTRDAVQGSCGHRFCQDCVNILLRNIHNADETIPCPGCVNEGCEEDIGLSKTTVFPDPACRRELNRTAVRCVYGNCQWEGLFKDFDSHCETCSSFPLDCRICGVQVQRDQMDNHLATHQDLTQKVRLDDLCPFGCGLQVEESGLSNHVNSSLSLHLRTIHNRLNAIQNIIAPSDEHNQQDLDKTMATRLGRLEFNLTQLQMQLPVNQTASKRSVSETATPGELVFELTVYEQVLTVLSSEVGKLTERLTIKGNESASTINTVGTKATALERKIAERDLTIQRLENNLMEHEQTSYDGTLIWKIANVSRHREEAAAGPIKYITSPPFYTSHTGYKLYIRAYLAGDGTGRSTHLSVYIVIARGRYDALLSWPFRQRITLMLLDQVSGNERGHVTDSFRPDSGSSYQRPRDDTNKAVGVPQFTTLANLTGQNNVYVRDDCMFIKAVVDLDGLS